MTNKKGSISYGLALLTHVHTHTRSIPQHVQLGGRVLLDSDSALGCCLLCLTLAGAAGTGAAAKENSNPLPAKYTLEEILERKTRPGLVSGAAALLAAVGFCFPNPTHTDRYQRLDPHRKLVSTTPDSEGWRTSAFSWAMPPRSEPRLDCRSFAGAAEGPA